MIDNDEGRLRPLAELPALEVERDSTDVRGWEVVAPDARPIGVVCDLLVDADTLEAEYLLVRPLSRGGASSGADILRLPVAMVRLDPAAARVVALDTASTPVKIRVRYRSTTYLAWVAAAVMAAVLAAVLLVAWLLGAFSLS